MSRRSLSGTPEGKKLPSTLRNSVLSAVPVLPRPVAGPALFALIAAWGLIGWAFPPAQASRIVKLAPDAAPIVLSLNASALYLGVALGAVVGGVVLQYGGTVDLGIAAALFPLAGLGLLLLSLRVARPSAMPAE